MKQPYKFLEPYGIDDKNIFFGRDLEKKILLSDILSSRLVVLFAKTGCGKTSLINAGVCPLLEELAYATFYIRVEKDPVESLEPFLKEYFLFKWNKTPEEDEKRLRDFLRYRFDIDWVTEETIRIEEIDDNIKKYSYEKNWLKLKLDDKEEMVELEIDDGTTDIFIVKIERIVKKESTKRNINIYKNLLPEKPEKDSLEEQLNYAVGVLNKPIVVFFDQFEEFFNTKEYLFNWDEIPREELKLKNSLKDNLDINWVTKETARIEKNDSNTIKISCERNWLSLKLNKKETKVSFKMDDGKIGEFIVKKESGHLSIYDPKDLKKSKFISEIAKIYSNPKSYVHFVFSMREEFFINMGDFRDEIPSIFHNDSNLRLLPLTKEQANDAIVEPAKSYLFSWEKIPGNDSRRLIDFLIKNYGVDWVKTARIEKIENGKIIEVSTEKNYISLKLNDEQTEVNLEIDDFRTDKFVVKIENNKINIYTESILNNKKFLEKLLTDLGDLTEDGSIEPVHLQIVCDTLWKRSQEKKIYLFNWNEVPGNDNLRLIVFLAQKYDITWIKIAKCWFSWDEVPGNDSEKFIDCLSQISGIDWKNASIEKTDDIERRVSTEKNVLSLRLNDKKNNVTIRIDDNEIYYFPAKIEENKLNIYYIRNIRDIRIEKIDDDNTIRITSGKNSLSLRFTDEKKNKINFTINDVITDEFIVKAGSIIYRKIDKSDVLNVYTNDLEGARKIIDKRIIDDINGVLGTEDAKHFKKLLPELRNKDNTKNPQTKDELIKKLRTDANTLDKLVEKLEKKQLIKKREYPNITFIEWTSDYLAGLTDRLFLRTILLIAEKEYEYKQSIKSERKPFDINFEDFEEISNSIKYKEKDDDILGYLNKIEAQSLFEAALLYGKHILRWFNRLNQIKEDEWSTWSILRDQIERSELKNKQQSIRAIRFLVELSDKEKALELLKVAITKRDLGLVTIKELWHIFCLFSWDEIPGKDEERLIKYMKSIYDIDWLEPKTNIKKIDDMTIIVSSGKHSISLSRNEGTKIIVTIDDISTHELIGKKENDKLNIYGHMNSIKAVELLKIALDQKEISSQAIGILREIKTIEAIEVLVESILDNRNDLSLPALKALEMIANQDKDQIPIKAREILDSKRSLLDFEGAPGDKIEKSSTISIRRKVDWWNFLISKLNAGKCIPFIGSGVSEFSSMKLIADEWSKNYKYPFQDSHNLQNVAQFLSINYDHNFPKILMAEHIKKRMQEGKDFEIYRILADLPFRIYITTNFDDLLIEALIKEGKNPQKVIIDSESAWVSIPTEEEPVVLYLHGFYERPETMVLTQDDYLKSHETISTGRYTQTMVSIYSWLIQKGWIKEELMNSSLLFFGYNQTDWDFRAIFEGLVTNIISYSDHDNVNISVQSVPEGAQKQIAKEYLDNFFMRYNIQVYWGSCIDFANDLSEKWKEYIENAPYEPQYYPGTTLIAKNRRKFMTSDFKKPLRDMSDEDLTAILGHREPGTDYPSEHPPLAEMGEPDCPVREMVTPTPGAAAGDRVKYVRFVDSMYNAPATPYWRSYHAAINFRGISIIAQSGLHTVQMRERDLEGYTKEVCETEMTDGGLTKMSSHNTEGHSLRLQEDGVMFDMVDRARLKSGIIVMDKDQQGVPLMRRGVNLGKPMSQEELAQRTTMYRVDNVPFRSDTEVIEYVQRVWELRTKWGFQPKE